MRFIIIEQVSVYIPGDERSRTHPGHGYPATTETYNSIRWFDRAERGKWEEEVKRLTAQRRQFIAGGFVAATTETKISLTMEESNG